MSWPFLGAQAEKQARLNAPAMKIAADEADKEVCARVCVLCICVYACTVHIVRGTVAHGTYSVVRVRA